jgi:L-aspartate oxidase
MDLAERFPGIAAFLARYGLDLRRDLIPVRPAAHYLMGGVRTDLSGRSSLPGLYAAGEVACTGVHGANRLASNSLLEGLVFGVRAADAMMTDPQGATDSTTRPLSAGGADSLVTQGTVEGESSAASWLGELRELMWADAGLLRDAVGLRRARSGLAWLRARMPTALSREAIEGRNLLAVAELMVMAAEGRTESRGAHFRSDYPGRDEVARHSVISHGELRFVAA